MLDITHHSDELLLIEDKSVKAALLLMGIATFILLVGSQKLPSIWYALIGPVFLTFMAWLAYFKVTTTFDKKSGKIRYVFSRILRTTHKEYPFEQIKHIGLRLPPAAQGELRKLIQITFDNKDAIWLSPSAYIDTEALNEIVATIKAFLQCSEPEKSEQQVIDMIQAGNKLGAIKWLRATRGLTLKQAKEKVEMLLEENK